MTKITSQKQIVALSKKLMRIPSTEHNITAQEQVLKEIVTVFKKNFFVREYEFGGNPAIVLSTSKGKKTDIILSGHMDVAAGDEKIFEPYEKGSKLFGRGSYDMKASLVACIFAARDYVLNGGKKDIAILITTDEEVSGYGTQMLLEKEKYQADFAFIPDGGHESGVVLQQKGFLQLKVTLAGKSSHAAEQWKGKNPLDQIQILKSAVEKIYSGPTENNQWKTSAVITKIESSNSLNQIPQFVDVYIDIRYTKPTDVKKIISLIKKKIGINSMIAVVAENGMFLSDKNNHYVQMLVKTMSEYIKKDIVFVNENGTSDAIFFTEHSIPASLYRPKGGKPHQDGEWIDMKSLYTMYQVMRKFLQIS